MSTVPLWRFTASMLFGAAVTAAVFLVMQRLIEPEQVQVSEPPAGAMLAFVPEIKEQPPAPRDRRLPPPVDVLPPPTPPPVITNDVDNPLTTTHFIPPVLDDPTGPKAGTLQDGDALAVVKVQPVYPARAVKQGVEGYVLVEFTIDRLGRVVDVRIVDAKPAGMFDRAALKAVERFRYKPRVVNGEPIPVSGVQHLLTFELESG